MRGRLRLVLGLFVACVLVTGEVAGVAQADRGEPPAEAGISVAPNSAVGNVPAEQLAALQRDLKVTAEQAKARLVRADWATRLDKPLRQRLGAGYAGSWLAEDGQQFVVAIADPKLAGLVRASGATPKLVNRNESDLFALSAKLDARAKNPANVPDTVAGWAVDPQANRIRVQHLAGGRSAAESFAAAGGLTADQVGYELVPARSIPVSRNIEAGDAYDSDLGCTTGFAVFHPNIPGVLSRSGFLTAAHCGSIGANAYIRDPIQYSYLGIVAATAQGGAHDEAVVITEPGFFPVPRVNSHGHGTVLVSDGDQQVDGSPVCTSGRTTFWSCGTIRPGFHTDSPANGGYQNLKAHNICNLSGDSGGPVISGTHGQGIIVRGYAKAAGCPWFRFSTYGYYVPLQRALTQLGAELKTTPVPAPPPAPTPSPKWTTGKQFWGGLGGAVKGPVASVSLNPDHLQIFGRGSDDRLYTKIQTGGVWGDWQGLGDALTDPPTVLARAGGIDVYYRGFDTRPYVRRWNGSAWETAVKLGDIDVTGQIAAVSLYGGAHAALFIRSSNDEVYFAGHDGTKWSNWVGLGGDVNAAPTAIARPNAAGQLVLEVYARWADDNVRYRRADPNQPGFQPWVNLGGIFKEATPVGVTVGVDHSFLMGIARDNTLHLQEFRDGDWLRGAGGRIDNGWRGLGGSVYSQPAAIAGPGEQVRVLTRDANQQINMITWQGGDIRNWGGWTRLDGDTAVPVGANLRTLDQASVLDAFAVDAATGQPFHAALHANPNQTSVAVSDTGFTVGGSGFYTITGPPGAPISWSSTKDNVPVEDHAFYDQYLDSSGSFTAYTGEWSGSGMGSWVKQVHVGSETVHDAQVSFTVSPRPTAVFADNTQYRVGDPITYAVTGPPNQPIKWSSSIDGRTSGESVAFYNQYTDANGVFTFTTTWTDTRPGIWAKSVIVGSSLSGQVTFEVVGSPPPAASTAPMAANGRTLVTLRADGQIWVRERRTDGTWSSWYSLGGALTSSPAMVSYWNGCERCPTVTEVYAVGTDNAVWRNVQTGTGIAAWSGWRLAAPCCVQGQLAVLRDEFSRINVFGLGTDNQIRVTRQTSAGSPDWTGWQTLSGYMTSVPVAARDVAGPVVVARGGDNNLWYSARDNTGWGAWTNLGGGPVIGQPAITPGPQLVARRADNKIYATLLHDGNWTQVGDDAATINSPPTAADTGTFGDGPRDQSPYWYSQSNVFALGTDGRVYASRMHGCDQPSVECAYRWSPWTSIGDTAVLTQPAVGNAPGFGLLQAYAVRSDLTVVTNVQTQPNNHTAWSGWNPSW